LVLTVMAPGAVVAGAETTADHSRQAPGSDRLISVRGDGSQSPRKNQSGHVSGNGRFVAFYSNDAKMEGREAGTARIDQLYLTDLRHDTTQMVTRRYDGKPGNAGASHVGLTSNARLVVFQSEATNLVAGDTAGSPDVFIFDRVTGTTRLAYERDDVSAAAEDPAISADGSTVVFDTGAALTDEDTNGRVDVYAVDLATGDFTWVSRPFEGGQSGGGGFDPSVSGDGTRITYTTPYLPIAAIAMFDTVTGATYLVSRTPAGDWPNRSSLNSRISADGNHVVFASDAGDIAGLVHGKTQLFLHDIAAGTTVMVTVGPDGEPGDQSTTGGHLSISAHGETVAYDSNADNLVAGDPWYYDVFAYDAATETNVAMSLRGLSDFGGSVTADGSRLVYSTRERRVAEDDDWDWDVYLRRLS
jgi:Tol biopolymer transport system component